MTQADRYSVYRTLYGNDGYVRIANAKILVVGAGGIGCEVVYQIRVVGWFVSMYDAGCSIDFEESRHGGMQEHRPDRLGHH